MKMNLRNIEKIGIFREETLGRIYEGIITNSDRKVIVKQLIFPPSVDRKSRVRLKMKFLEDAEKLKSLVNASISTPLDFGEEDESAYVIFPLPSGVPFYNYLQMQKNRDAIKSLQIFKRIISSYKLLLDKGIKRTNVIPGDIFITPNNAIHFMDTTFAVFDKASGLYDMGFLTGDQSFYAPEQVKMGKADERTLVFSLGLVLYCLLTKTCLYREQSTFVSLSQIISKPVVLPSDITVAAETRHVLQRTLRKDENLRFANLNELIQAIDQCEVIEKVEEDIRSQETVVSEPPAPANRLVKIVGRLFFWLVIIVVSVFGITKIRQWFFESEFKVQETSLSPEAIRLRQAREALMNMQWHEASVLAQNVLNNNPDSYQAHSILGESLLNMNKPEEAEKHLSEVIKSGDRSSAYYARWYLAEAKLMQKNYAEAEEIYQELIDASNDPSVINGIMKRRDNLIKMCSKDARNILSADLSETEKIKTFEDYAGVIRKINNNAPEYYFVQGLLDYVNGNNENSYANLNQYLNQHPDDAFATAILRKIVRARSQSR